MQFLDLFKLSTRMFRTRPTRTWLTILGVGVGIGAVLFLVSLGYGLQRLVFQNIVTNDALLTLTVVSPDTDTIPLNQQRIEEFSKIKEVENIAPLAVLPAQISLNDLNANITLKAVSPNYFNYAGISPDIGKFFKLGDKKIIVSKAIPKLFNIQDPEAIIDKQPKIQIFSSQEGGNNNSTSTEATTEEADGYKISGIAGGSQSVFVYFPLFDLQKMIKITQYSEVKVKVKESQDLEKVRGEIINQGFQVSSLTDTIDQARKIFDWVRIGLGFLGAIALFVAAVGMLNTMVVTLLERTQEIGIMRAIGASRRNIKYIFILEATLMGFLGGLSGIAVGFLGGTLFNWFLNILAAGFGGKAVRIFAYPSWFIITIVVVSTVLGFISGFFPARKAAKLDPLDALRYK